MTARLSLLVSLASILLAACGSKTDSNPNAEAKAATPPPPPPAAVAPAPAGDGKVTPKHLPPFEAIVFTKTAEKEANGWPKFDAVNHGDKKIVFAAVTGFAYDKSGKLVKRLTTPLSWNTTLEPGGKSMFAVSVGAFEKENVTADKFELCYDSLKYDGDDKFVEDKTLCTDSRPVGGVKSAGGDAAGSAAPSAAAHAGHGAKHGKKK
jgi:hypothetical protein